MSIRWRYGEYLTVILVVGTVAAKNATEVDTKNPCKNKDTCRECIQTSNCVWCKVPNFAEDRCFLSNTSTTCTSIEHPVTKITDEIKRPLTTSGSKSRKAVKNKNREIVQLMPQYIKLELRPSKCRFFMNSVISLRN